MTPEEQAERASLTAALAEYHAHPGRYLLPKLEAGCWTPQPHELPPVAPSGYTYQPPQDWLTAPDFTAAMDVYRLQQGRVGYPVPGIDPATGQPIWLLHPRVGQVADRRMTMADYQAIHAQGTGRVTGGSSAKNAELTAQDRARIAEEARLKKQREAEDERLTAERAAARALKQAAKEAEAERRRQSQGSMLEETGA